MPWWLYLFILLQLVGGTLAGVAGAQQDDRELDHKKLQRLVEGFARAWNQADVPALTKYLDEEALLITPMGGGNNRQEIQNRIALEHEGRLRGTHLSPSVMAIDFPTDNIAVLEGSYKIAGVHLGLRLRRTLEGPIVFRFQRNGSDWKIVRARLYRASEKKLALREAHNERYPFIQSAAAGGNHDS